MVMLGKEREREAEELMAMGPERSKPLHNFKMPCLKWGSQRLLRCMKVNPNGDDSSAAGADQRFSASEVEKGLIGRRGESEHERWGCFERAERKDSFKKSPSPAAGVGGSGRKSKAERYGDEEIEVIKTKLMFDLQTAADKIKDAILGDGLEEDPPAASVSPEAEAVRPWNLRTRRAACKAPNGAISGGGGGGGGGTGNGGGAKSLNVDERKPNYSPLRTENKSPKLRGDVTVAAADAPTGEKRDRVKFSVSLSRREIEKDFVNLTGHRPPRRPKKRPKIVQKQLDTLFPGLWLTEVTADIYKVPDAPENENR